MELELHHKMKQDVTQYCTGQQHWCGWYSYGRTGFWERTNVVPWNLTLTILAQSSLGVASFPGAPPRTGNEATLDETFFIAADIQRMMRVHPEFICASITYQHIPV